MSVKSEKGRGDIPYEYKVLDQTAIEKDNYQPSTLKHDPLRNLSKSDKLKFVLITSIAFYARLAHLESPSSVVFDEVHFGGFASKYIKGRFFMDVHPPLAKMLYALVAWLAGFDGHFTFHEIGLEYVENNVPYVVMRLYPALLGALTVPLFFLTIMSCRCTSSTAFLGSLLLTFENGLLTQSRYILLDSPLVFCTALTAFGWFAFENQTPFSKGWWSYLLLTGLGLGATVSVKWVGLFTIAWVGAMTLNQLWKILGDQNVRPTTFVRHFSGRAICLILFPVAFYLAMFAIHFLCLVNPGDGDGFMSPEFQSTLNSKSIDDVPANVALGARITFRHLNTNGGYFHSHPHNYPGGSGQQQVTLYPHKDDNNVWEVENRTMEADYRAGEPVYIKDGDVIRLRHISTHCRAHSHGVRPAFSDADWINEASCYGPQGFEGDANDYFRVEIDPTQTAAGPARNTLRALETKFRLVHTLTGCALFSRKSKLPDWGFGQQEVFCTNSGIRSNSLWVIEDNEHPMYTEKDEKVNFKKPSFLGKFLEVHKVMFVINQGLTDSHNWESRPPSWFYLGRGINFWGKHHRHIYLTGNFVTWWLSSTVIAIFFLVKVISILRWQRGYQDYEGNSSFQRYNHYLGASVTGWAVHYFPFYLMQRQLFLHHYFPALYFAIIAFTQTWDILTTRVIKNKIVVSTLTLSVAASALAVHFWYAPLMNGGKWTRSDCEKSKLLSTWDFNCGLYPETYDFYKKYDSENILNPDTLSETAGQAEKSDDAGENEQPSQDPTSFSAYKPPLNSKAEQVVYRNEKGEVLDPKDVEKMKNVKLETKYKRVQKVVDAQGNLVSENLEEYDNAEDYKRAVDDYTDEKDKVEFPSSELPPEDVEPSPSLDQVEESVFLDNQPNESNTVNEQTRISPETEEELPVEETESSK